jgi:flavodoxin
MNTFVVYDSQYGNTERIAQTIADTLRPFGQVQVVRVDPVHPFAVQEGSLLVLGSPTQGMRPTPAIQSFLARLSSQQLRDLTVACFDTRFRGFFWKLSAAPSLVKQLRKMGVEPLVPPESFFVKSMKKEGPLEALEIERAGTWALTIQQHFQALHPNRQAFEESKA